MKKPRYWKSTYVVTVLSEGVHPPEYGNLHELANNIGTGDACGDYTHASREVTEEEMRSLLKAQHMDPEFLIPKCDACNGKGRLHTPHLEDQRSHLR